MNRPIGILTYNRPELLRISLQSLAKTGMRFHAFDDISDPETLRILGNYTDKVFINPTRLGSAGNLFRLCDYLSGLTSDYFIRLDSDFIFNPSVFAELDRLYHKYRHIYKIAMIGPFLSIYHQNTYQLLEDCRLVMSLTPATLITVDFWREFKGLVVKGANKGDVAMNYAARDLGYKLLCTKRSFAQHIGITTGLHASFYEVAYDFVGENNEFKQSDLRPGKNIGCWKHHSPAQIGKLMFCDNHLLTIWGNTGYWNGNYGDQLMFDDMFFQNSVKFSNNTYGRLATYGGLAKPRGCPLPIQVPVSGVIDNANRSP